MSFPVLQRMDRKRPEMIQPISWQAEAMKGLAQGLQTGMQLASTVNQIKLQQAANTRAEALHGVELQLAQQRGKAQDLAMRKLNLDVKQAEMENMMGIAQSDAAIKLESNKIKMQEYAFMGETLKDTSKISQLRAERFDIGIISDPAAASLLAGAYNKNIPPEQNRAMTMAAEKFSPAAARAVLSVLPQPLFDEIEQKPVHIDVTDSNRGSAIAAFSAQAEGSPEEIQQRLQSLEAGQTKTIAVRFGTLVQRVRDDANGSVDMLAQIYKSRDATPEAVSTYLAARNVSPTQIKKVTDAMQGKTVVADDRIGTASSAFVSDSINQYIPEQAVADSPIVSTVKIGGQDVNVIQPKSFFDKIGETAVSMVEGIKDRIMDDTPNDILIDINERAKAISRNAGNEADKIVARYQYLKRELDQLTSEQRKAAADPTQTNEANKLAVVMERLRDQVMEIEQARFKKATTGATTPSSAPASAPATAGVRTSRPVQGDVVEGYRFKGGDPSKPENWEKVQ